MELMSGQEVVRGSSLGHRRALSSLASIESLSMPLMQEVVLSADIKCVECRKRIAYMMTRMGEVESMTVSVSEMKVTLSCRYSYPDSITTPKIQVPAIPTKSINRMALVKKFFLR